MTQAEGHEPAVPRRVALALQGGGSLGAYTWGVLEVLLERDRFEIAGVTGASAGALNAALLADGTARAGVEGARERLESFWMGLSARCAARRRSPVAGALRALRSWAGPNTTAVVHDVAGSAMADFDWDPRTMEPLRGAIAESIDFARVAAAPFPVFVNTTEVTSFTLRVFAGDRIDLDVLCASACVPLVFEAVEIAGEHHWDGAFLGNPALFPVIDGTDASDIVLVQTAPVALPLPGTAEQLLSRITQLSFGAALARERRAIEFVSGLVHEADGALPEGRREIRIHDVPPHPALADQAGRCFDVDEANLRRLRALGREACAAWLDGLSTPSSP